MTTLAAVLALALAWPLSRPEPAGPVTRISVQIPEEQFFNPNRGDLELSDDGSLLVYRGADEQGRAQLWARRWNALDAVPIRGTNGAANPAISPDGLEVAFSTGGAIRVVPLQGAVSRALAEGVVCCPAWSSDGAWIYYSEPSAGLRRVPAGGGSPEIVTENTGPGAYVSNNTGRDEVYVRPFPDAGSGLGQVSADGGFDPVWAHSGRELFYRNGANELVAVQVSGDPTFVAGQRDLKSHSGMVAHREWPDPRLNSGANILFLLVRVRTQPENR